MARLKASALRRPVPVELQSGCAPKPPLSGRRGKQACRSLALPIIGACAVPGHAEYSLAGGVPEEHSRM